MESFYLDDGLVRADSIEDAIQLPEELQHLFSLGGFELTKWKTSEKAVEQSIAKQLRYEESSCPIKHAERFTKVLEVEWNAITDTFRPVRFRQPAQPETQQTAIDDLHSEDVRHSRMVLTRHHHSKNATPTLVERACRLG